MDAKSIIKAYKNKYHPDTQRELSWFRSQPSLRLAIEKAALAQDDGGKRYSHQWRIRKVAIAQAYEILTANEHSIQQAADFDDLFARIDQLLKKVDGIGEMYIYDTTLRIGAKLGYLPQVVYLHRGTRKGAKALGLQKKDTVRLSEFPEIFRNLEPYKVEDILCIFKGKLGEVADWGDKATD